MIAGKLGEIAGLATGVTVTLALRLSRKWNAPIVDQGRPVTHIPGAARLGDHDLRQRHQEVVGPMITARALSLPDGALREVVAGFGEGATNAPGATYRLEVKVEDALKTLGVKWPA
jgi:hypothetical protein